MSEALASLARQYLSMLPADGQAEPAQDAPAVDMSQLQEPPASAPPPAQQTAQPPAQPPPPFAELPQRQVPVSNAGAAYTQQGQDERAYMNQGFTDANNMTAEGVQRGMQASQEDAAVKAATAQLKQPALDEDAQIGHEAQTAYERTLAHFDQRSMELEKRVNENLDRMRAAAQERPTGAWSSANTQRQALGIVNVLLAVGGRQGAGAIMSSLNQLFVADASQEAAHDARLKEYQLNLGNAQKELRDNLASQKSYMELGIALRKENVASYVGAAANKLAPSAARTEMLNVQSKLLEGSAKDIVASKAHEAEFLLKNDEANTERYKAVSGRLTADAEMHKAVHGAEDNMIESDEMDSSLPTKKWSKDALDTQDKKEVKAAKLALHTIDKVFQDNKEGLVKGARLQKIDQASLVYDAATALGITRHDIHTLAGLFSAIGLNYGDRAFNSLQGVSQKEVLQRLQRRLKDTITESYKMADPHATPHPGGYVERIENENKVLDAIDSIRGDNSLTREQKKTALLKLNEAVTGDSKVVNPDISMAFKQI